MTEPDRIEDLKHQHATLERAIENEHARPMPNHDAIADLKRQKLRIKDELYQLRADTRPLPSPGVGPRRGGLRGGAPAMPVSRELPTGFAPRSLP